MAKQNEKGGNTIFQGLNKLMNLDGMGFTDPTNANNSQKSGGEPKKIIKGESPAEIKRKALELQQQEELRKKFFKIEDHAFQKAMQYEAARLPAYVDYEGMEYYPIIAQALTLLSEEATTIGENGKMLNVYSKKERIKFILEDLFYNRLNINVNLQFWIRNLCKFGDNFVYLLSEKGKGIVYAHQMVNYEIERLEKVKDGKLTIQFKHKEKGDTYHAFEMAHFRLLGDDKYLPYGSSELNKIRRVFRQLVLGEDAMLTYRILRAGEKRVFKIEVGNMDDKDIEAYIYKVSSKFKKQQQVDANTGQIDYRFNILGNDEDFFIPVRSLNAGTVIEPLPGAENLDKIQDIEYLRDNLFTGLGIPKPFLSYQDAAGDGKNLAQFDVRFAKKINRIQQAVLLELNKIAVLHLYMLGFHEDITNFSLSLSNPSVQADLLKYEVQEKKFQIYHEATAKDEGGIAPTSHTWAKKNILNWSDKEIIDDLKQQRMEMAVSQELQDSSVYIQKSGIFKDVDDKYGTDDPIPQDAAADGEGSEEMNEPQGPEGDGNFSTPTDLPPPQGAEENKKSKGKILHEKKSTKEFGLLAEEMILNKDNLKEKVGKDFADKYERLDEETNKMIDEIDEMLETNDKVKNS